MNYTATILRIYAKCVSWWPRGSTIFRPVICGLLTISQMGCKSQEVLTATCLVVLLVVLLAFLVLFIIFLVLNTGDDSSAMTGPVFNHKGWITTPTIISWMFRISNACGLSQPCWRMKWKMDGHWLMKPNIEGFRNYEVWTHFISPYPLFKQSIELPHLGVCTMVNSVDRYQRLVPYQSHS